MNLVLQNLASHWQAYGAAATALSVAAICCMPAERPRSLDAWWKWMRDSLQTAVPAARAHQAENPTQSNPK